MASLVVKNNHQNDMCHDKIELGVHNVEAINGSIMNTIDMVYVIA
jgi:hypothetical protein